MVTVAASLATGLAMGGVLWIALRNRRMKARPTRSRNHMSGLDVSPTQFWGVVVGIAAATFIVVFAVTGLVVVSVVPALVVATLPKAYFVKKRSARTAAIQEAWPDGLRDILGSVRSGASIPSALENLASFGPASLRDAFGGFGVYARSLGVVAALEMVRDDLADPTSDRIIEVLILAYERGGTVVPRILADLAEATTRDLWTMEQIRTEVLEQKINSRVVFVLPWLVLIAMTAQSSAFRDFYSSTAGVAVVLVGGALSLGGVLIASRLGRRPAEPRVFGGLK